MFIDAKMPLSRREVIPLLVDASGQILWIAGFRRSKHALVGPDTERVLHLKARAEVTCVNFVLLECKFIRIHNIN